MQRNEVKDYNRFKVEMATRPPARSDGRANGRNTQTGKMAQKSRKKPGRLKSWLLIFLLLVLAVVLSPFVIVQLINNTNESRVYASVQATPARPVAIVFGAGLNRDGSPSWMLADRLDSAIALYKAGKVQQLLMTGDDITSREVTSMTGYARRHGVPAAAILTDTAGLRTYDSCYRASHNFGINQAVLVTQAYHLPRALYLCNSLGVDSVGLKAGQDNYPNQEYYNSREFLATFLSWVDVTITQPKPEITSIARPGS